MPIHKIKFFLAILVVIFAVCFLAYSNSLKNPFIWDDEGLVVKNTLIRSTANIPLSFTNDLYFGIASGSNFYRPLQTISYIFDYHFWQLDPFGYHLTNIILQCLVSFLVFLFIFTLLQDFSIAAVTGLFFAAHPIHSESVSYISGRAEMLMGFFLILSLLLFIKSQATPAKPLIYILSLISFIFALLSKEMAVIFPVIICGYIFYFLNHKLKEKFYFFKTAGIFILISAAYLILRISIFSFQTLRAPSLTSVPFFTRLSVLPKIVLIYLKLLLLPVDLHMSRELIRPVSPAGLTIAYCSLALLIFVCVHYLRPGKNRFFSFMLFWALAFFLPQSGIFPINAFVAEHFIYLSSISFFLLVSCALKKYLRRSLFILSTGLICLVYTMFSYSRNVEWGRPIVFYGNILKYSPDSFQAHNNLGLQYEYKGRFDEATKHYKKALEIKPDLIEARSNLANLYFKLKLYKEAKSEYELLEKSPLGAKAGEVRNNLGNIYEAAGDLEGAILKYSQALELDPRLKFTHFNLARIYFSKGKVDFALDHIGASLNISSGRPGALEVVRGFIKNKRPLSGAAEFYNDLGIEFSKVQLWDEAFKSFNCALELKPDAADYFYNIGLVYLYTGKKNEARNAFKSAVKIDPNHIAAKGLMSIKNYKK